jgi:hypothetical protein
VALMPQWRQDYPNNRPPTRATAISAMGQNRPLALQKRLGQGQTCSYVHGVAVDLSEWRINVRPSKGGPPGGHGPGRTGRSRPATGADFRTAFEVRAARTAQSAGASCAGMPFTMGSD